MSEALTDKARSLLRDHFGIAPEGVVFAPGRVNLIGEHVDYNDGLVLPMPVASGTAIAWARSAGPATEVFAADYGANDWFPAHAPGKPEAVDWRSYVRGMVAHMGGDPTPLRLAITGDLPRGSGLSSSASLCIAVGQALAAARSQELDTTTLARQAQATEHDYAGVACGIMDQMAIAGGREGEAMLLDCRDLAYSHVSLPQEWGVAVVDSGVTRGLVEGEYNARRKQCEAAASALGVESLRDAEVDLLETSRLPAVEERRARHVIGEIARVQQAKAAIAKKDLAAFGEILREGHASLRDLFEVSHPQVDALVDRLDRAIGRTGGARMTGAGFGGSVVVVMARERLDDVIAPYGERALRVL